MRTRAMMAATAMIFSNLVPVLGGAAFAGVTLIDPVPDAAGPSGGALLAMAEQCAAKAVAHGPAWTGELDESSITPTLVSGPTEIGTHSIDDALAGTLVGAGTYTPAQIQYSDPFRNGGSVNMWANGTATGGYYSASEYDFAADFETKYSYAFNCTMSELVHHRVEGYYEVQGEHGESEDAIRANCAAYTAMGDDLERPAWWGQDHGGKPGEEHCKFVMTSPEEDVEEDRPDEAGTPVEETQTDTLTAHEDAGEGYFDSEPAFLGKILVCISPTTTTSTKKGAPGSWVAKHGYSGEKCTTAWYNTGAMAGVSNLNTTSNNIVTIPVILP